MKKRLFVIISALLMLFSSSFAEDRNLTPFSAYTDVISTALTSDDRFFILSYNLYEIDINTGNIKQKYSIEFDDSKDTAPFSIDAIYGFNDKLLGFCTSTKRLFEIKLNGSSAKVDGMLFQFDIDHYMDLRAAQASFVQDNVFYLLDISLEDLSGSRKLYALDLYNNALSEIVLPKLYTIYPSSGKNILILEKPDNYNYFDAAHDFTLCKLDLTNGTKDKLFVLNNFNSYNAPSVFSRGEEIFIADGSLVNRLNKDGSKTLYAYIPQSGGAYTKVFALKDGSFAFMLGENMPLIAIRSLNLDALPKESIKVLQFDGNLAIKAASLMLGRPAVLGTGSFYNTDLLSLIENEDFELIELNAWWLNIKELIEKGCFAPIEDEKLIAFIENSAPAVREAVSYNGKYYGVPIMAEASTVRVNSEGFKSLNLPLPQSYYSMLEGYYAFGTDESLKNSSYVYSLDDIYFTSPRKAAELYAADKIIKGEAVVFNSPDFIRLIELIRKNAELMENFEPNEEYEPMDMTELVITYSELMADYRFEEGNYPQLKIGLFDGDAPFLCVETAYYFINAKSDKKDGAYEYLNNVINSLSPLEKVHIAMKADAPVENPNYEQELEQLNAEYQQVINTLLSLSGDEKEEFEYEHSYLLENFVALQNELKYIISEEQRQSFTEAANQNLIVLDQYLDLFLTEDFISDELEERFLDGQMSAADFASELDRMLVERE